jgi:hypothetical protein
MSVEISALLFGEDVILIEKGEYKYRTCSNIIAQYRKFNK